MEILPVLPSVDLIVTDPPYKLTSGGNTNGRMLGGFMNKYNNDGMIVDCDIHWSDFMPLLAKVLPQGHAYIMANNRNVQDMLNAAEAAGFEFHNLLVWDKVSATANRWYMKNLEFTGFFYRGKAQMINDCSAKQLIRCPQVDYSQHPTEKPVPLFEHYIENSSMPGQMVLDPFCGAGTTGVAAIRTGRKAILIEKNGQWFQVTCERLAVELENRQLKIY